MPTCTIDLYYGTKLKPEKNFVIDDIEVFLATRTSVQVTGVQYQKWEINKRIKLNLKQDYQGNAYLPRKFDYLRIYVTEKDMAQECLYYYFIKRYEWLGESTIALDLEMDVLNTYSFVNSLTQYGRNRQYLLSNKSLITREHKDRMKVNQNYIINTNNPASFDYQFNSIDLMDNGTINLTSLAKGHLINDEKYIYDTFEFNKIIVLRGIFNELYAQFYNNNTLVRTIYPQNLYAPIILSISNTNDYNTINTSEYVGFVQGFRYCYFTRIIDRFQEGMETYLFKKNEEKLLDDDNEKTYYLVYSNANNVISNPSDTNPIFVNPIHIGVCTDIALSLIPRSAINVTIYADDERIPKKDSHKECLVVYKSQLTGGAYVRVSGNVINDSTFPTGKDILVIIRTNNNDVVFASVDYALLGENFAGEPALENPIVIAENVDSVEFYGIRDVECWTGYTIYYTPPAIWTGASYHSSVYIGSDSTNETRTLKSWKQVDLTDAKLVKAINFPYSPNDWLVGKRELDGYPSSYTYNASMQMFELIKSQENDFDRDIHFNTTNPLSKILIKQTINDGENRNDVFESKIYHSDFYQPKFVYDSYGFVFNLENVNTTTFFEDYKIEEFVVRYVVSGNVLSKFMFQFVQYTCDVSTQDYENILLIDRNNEKALYSSAYVNYIKTGGFSYDTKKANSQNAINGVMTALQVVGAVGSFVGGAVSGNPLLAVAGVGLAVSTASSVIRNIHVAQEQDKAISQKLLQSANQAMSVNGSEDIDILRAFSGNKAKMVYYEPSDIMKQALLDLFYYCGYATHEQKIPNVSTRKYFNFVQGEIILDEYYFNDEIATAIVDKWKEGITFIHHCPNYIWDIGQEKENYEVSLL